MNFLEQIAEILPKHNDVVSLLIFLLMVFGGLYILFQLLFRLGDAKPKKKKEKQTKEDNVSDKTQKVKEKKEKQKKEKVVLLEDTLTFLEEDAPYVETRPFYSHEHKDSYIVGLYDGEVKDYSYGDNYLHEYFNDGKTTKYIEEVAPVVEKPTPQPVQKSSDSDYRQKSEEIVEAYKDLPSELKQYIINKLTRME